jgi:septal ring factor EnvC (AmiA/AmiB activator)
MNEENTADLTQDEKLDLILAEIRVMKADIRGLDVRLTSLEAKVADRLLDTRPLWEVISARTEMIVERVARIEEQNARTEERVARIEEQNARIEEQNARIEERVARIEEQNERTIETLRQIDSKLEVMTHDVLDVRAAQRILASRVYALEQRPS